MLRSTNRRLDYRHPTDIKQIMDHVHHFNVVDGVSGDHEQDEHVLKEFLKISNTSGSTTALFTIFFRYGRNRAYIGSSCDHFYYSVSWFQVLDTL